MLNIFVGCSNLKDVNLEAISKIGDYAFYGCSNLKEVNLQSITRIGSYAFYGCEDMEPCLPESIAAINGYAFYGNRSLKALDISVRNLGDHAFANCKELTQVNIGGDLSYSTFEDCTSLKSVVIRPGVNVIWGGTFSGCTALSSVDIPEGVKRIENGAFDGCALEEITIPESVAELGDACTNCDNLNSVNIKSISSWLKMEENTFSLKGGRKLLVDGNLVKEVNFPESDRWTGIKANFKNYEYLESISIPDLYSGIGDDAFDGCDNLCRIYCYAERPPHLSDHAFSDKCIQLATVYVPGHLLETYRQNQPDPAYINCHGRCSG
jgi:hypothetical protein